MTFDQDYSYSYTLFSSLLKKKRKRKGERISKNRDQRSCLSARSYYWCPKIIMVPSNYGAIAFKSVKELSQELEEQYTKPIKKN